MVETLRRRDILPVDAADAPRRDPRPLLGVAILAGGLLVAGLVLYGRSRPAPVVVAARSAGPPVTASPAEVTHSIPTVLVVHVAGAVAAPGVARVLGPARVVDVVAAAGGATADADTDAVNLARPVVDGERVYIPRHGEAPVPMADAGSGAGTPAGLIDLNTATIEQLDGLPGIGPVLAKRIVDHRAEHGRFPDVQALVDVSGIGDRLLEQLEGLVTVR